MNVILGSPLHIGEHERSLASSQDIIKPETSPKFSSENLGR